MSGSPSTPIGKKLVATVPQFLDEIACIREEWSKLPEKHRPEPYQELWFRGEEQDYQDSALVPKLYRTDSPPVDAGMADGTSGTLIDLDSDLYDDFRRRGAELSTSTWNERDVHWKWYYLMQHYGAPTRLLDWSDGSLIALHFAVNGNAAAIGPRVFVLNSYALYEFIEQLEENKNAASNWAKFIEGRSHLPYGPEDWYNTYLPRNVDDRKWNGLPMPANPLVNDPEQITRRLSAQRSRLLIFGSDPKWLQRMMGCGDILRTVQIDPEADALARIRCQLRDAGVTESVIYPDLEGVGREMMLLWRERSDAMRAGDKQKDDDSDN